MTRIPTVTEAGIQVRPGGVGAGAAPRVSVSAAGGGGAAVAARIAIGGQSIAAAFEKIGRMKLAAYRARTLTEIETSSLTATDFAEKEAAQVDPNVAGAAFEGSAQLGRVQQEIAGITNGPVRQDAETIFARTKARGAIRVRGAAERKTAGLVRAAVDQLGDQLQQKVRTGGLQPGEAVEKLAERVQDGIGSGFTAETAGLFMFRQTRAIYDQYFELLLNGDEESGTLPAPDQIEEFLNSEEAQKVYTPGQSRELRRIADREMLEANNELFQVALQSQKRSVDEQLFQPASHETFAAIVTTAAKLVMNQKGYKDARVNGNLLNEGDVRRFLLLDSLKQTARSGDAYHFNVVMGAMVHSPDHLKTVNADDSRDRRAMLDDPNAFEVQGDSATGALVEQWRNQLNTAMRNDQLNRITAATVASAISGGYRLSGTPREQAELDKTFDSMVTQITTDVPNIDVNSLNRQLINMFGKTSVVPTQFKRQHTAVMQAPKDQDPAAVAASQQALTYLKDTYLAAYETFDRDIKDLHSLTQSLATAGEPMAKTVIRADEMMNPSDPVQAKAIDQMATTIMKSAMSSFTELIERDMGLDLQGDIEVEVVGNTRPNDPLLTLDLTQVDAAIPASMIRVYSNNVIAFRKAGDSQEAAVHKAWGLIREAGYAPSGVMSGSRKPRIVQASPEFMSGQSTIELKEDFANIIGLIHDDLITSSGESLPGFPAFDVGGESFVPGRTVKSGEFRGAQLRGKTPNVNSLVHEYRREIADELDPNIFGKSILGGLVGSPPRTDRIPGGTESEISLRRGAEAAFRDSGQRVLRPDHLQNVKRYMRDSLRMRVIGNQDGGFNYRRPDGKLGPAYHIFHINEDGEEEQVFRRVQRGDETFIEPYIVVPDPTGGLTYWRDHINKSIELQQTQRDEVKAFKFVERFNKPKLTGP